MLLAKIIMNRFTDEGFLHVYKETSKIGRILWKVVYHDSVDTSIRTPDRLVGNLPRSASHHASHGRGALPHQVDVTMSNDHAAPPHACPSRTSSGRNRQFQNQFPKQFFNQNYTHENASRWNELSITL